MYSHRNRSRFASFAFIMLAVLHVGPTAAGADSVHEKKQNPTPASYVDGENAGYTGVLKPSRQALLRPPASGTVLRMDVREGDRVKTGDSLLSLDDRLARSRLAVAVSQAELDGSIKSAEVHLELMQAELRAIADAMQTRAASQYEYERKVAETEKAEAALQGVVSRKNQMDAAIELARSELQQLTLSAPFDGEVIQIMAELGSTISPTEDAIQIAQLQELKVVLYVPLVHRQRLIIGNEFELMDETGFHSQIKARLSYVSPVIHPSTRSIRCVFIVNNEDRSVPAGLHVRLRDLAR